MADMIEQLNKQISSAPFLSDVEKDLLTDIISGMTAKQKNDLLKVFESVPPSSPAKSLSPSSGSAQVPVFSKPPAPAPVADKPSVGSGANLEKLGERLGAPPVSAPARTVVAPVKMVLPAPPKIQTPPVIREATPTDATPISAPAKP